MIHPHPDTRHVMRIMRTYLLGVKKKCGTARGLGHAHDLLHTYLTAKREVRTAQRALCASFLAMRAKQRQGWLNNAFTEPRTP